MSSTKMLIDATHPEETRVVVQRNGRVEEFDFESATRKLLRGNIYLAKVTRVEPSLQAAFVDYGGNRHGFLAFNEIHPDYYQIPVADRQALLDEEAAAEAELEAAADRRAEALARRGAPRDDAGTSATDDGDAEDAGEAAPAAAAAGEASHIVDVEEDEHIEEVGGEASDEAPTKVVAASIRETSEKLTADPVEPHQEPEHHDQPDEHATSESDVTGEEMSPYGDDAGLPQETQAEHPDDDHSAGDDHDANGARDGDDSHHSPRARSSRGFQEDGAPRQRRRPRSYKIQEVIKRRQIILVQVVKEERGNKGAALTTYLSLAGRYTVLMPNTARGGGISRKITNPQDRRRLKSIAQELEVPEGMGLIIRTAGAARTKQEIKRDFEYLLRLWESVRELTLQSTAPSLVYEEGDLIKRSIRDLYNKDVEEIVVAGDAGHLEAADFMKMLMPSHARNVVAYKEPTPLFTRYGVERQLNAMFQPQVTLRSGGYIVINQTEALVAIDVNSGKSTREFSIEETALATNLEAADEIARQLKLRDLAGLIVIDFIDMEEKRNNRSVERRLKDALRFDRARIQLGRISHFGLMEMSRQRLRTGVLEGSTSQCPHCQGTGIIRSTESVALAVLRGLEDTITAGANGPLVATTTPVVALYILNSKRAYIADMETRHGHTVTVLGSDRVHGANFTVERGVASALPARRSERTAVNMDWGFDGEEEAPAAEIQDIEMAPDAADGETESRAQDGQERNFDRGDGDDNGQRRGRRRRRRGRGGRDHGDRDRHGYEARSGRDGPPSEFETDDQPPATNHFDADASNDDAGTDQPDVQEANGEDRPGRRRRRGRRGGRRGRERRPDEISAETGDAANDDTDQPHVGIDPADEQDTGASDRHSNGDDVAPAKPSRAPRSWEIPVAANADEKQSPSSNAVATAASIAEPEPAPVASPARRRHETGSSEPRIERVVVKPGDADGGNAESPPAPQRKGWWQRNFGGS